MANHVSVDFNKDFIGNKTHFYRCRVTVLLFIVGTVICFIAQSKYNELGGRTVKISSLKWFTWVLILLFMYSVPHTNFCTQIIMFLKLFEKIKLININKV